MPNIPLVNMQRRFSAKPAGPSKEGGPKGDTAVEAPQSPLFAEQLGTTFVTVNVGAGEDLKCFTLHKDILCRKSPFFDAMFNGNFEEAKTHIANLPHDDAEAFQIVVSFVYLDTIEYPKEMDKHSPLPTLMAVYAFAEKAQMSRLKDFTMNSMTSLMLTRGWFPTPEDMEFGYIITPDKSALRLFLSRSFVYILHSCFDDPIVQHWNSDKMTHLLTTNKDLALDAFKLMRGQNGVTQKDPRRSPACEYHEHKGKKCPYKAVNGVESPPVTPAKRKKSS